MSRGKTRHCTEKKLKKEQPTGPREIPPKYRRQGNFTTYFFDYAKLCFKNTLENRTKGYPPNFPKRGDLKITGNYRGITLTVIAAMVYNGLLLNQIWPEVVKILGEKESIHNFTYFDYQLNHWWSTRKKSQKQKSNGLLTQWWY